MVLNVLTVMDTKKDIWIFLLSDELGHLAKVVVPCMKSGTEIIWFINK